MEPDWVRALRRLVAAADVYAADQSGAVDDRIGLVQPITVADGNELNEALKQAEEHLDAYDTNQPLPDIGTHFAQALADGRYEDPKHIREMRFGRHDEKRHPSDPLPEGMKFGGQIPMDDSRTNDL